MFKNITKFMAVSHGKVHEFKGYEDVEFKVVSEQTDSMHLNQEEIQKIYELDITEELFRSNGYENQNLKTTIKSLSEERDRFLFGCFTALRHSDYSRLVRYILRMILFGFGQKRRIRRYLYPCITC